MDAHLTARTFKSSTGGQFGPAGAGQFAPAKGGQFGPAKGGQFEPAGGGQIETAGGGQIDRRLQLLFFIATIFNICKDNYIFSASLVQLSYFSFLDTKTTCTIFISLVGLIIVRDQFVLGFKPKIVYEAKKSNECLHPELQITDLCWQVKIKNVGLGSAEFINYNFRLGIADLNFGEYDLTFVELISTLNKLDIILERDFYLSNITAGYALPAKEEKIILEYTLPNAHNLKQLDIKMLYSGPLGEKYEKEVFLIPRRGIPQIIL